MNGVDPVPPPLSEAIQFPDGAWVRGRALRREPQAGPHPTFGLYLGVPYRPSWQHHYIAWRDFGLPRYPRQAAQLLRNAHEHALCGGRVEIACNGGLGRTGTALAALAVLAGVHPDQAVRWTRQHYDRRAVETPWQRLWVQRFPRLLQPDLG